MTVNAYIASIFGGPEVQATDLFPEVDVPALPYQISNSQLSSFALGRVFQDVANNFLKSWATSGPLMQKAHIPIALVGSVTALGLAGKVVETVSPIFYRPTRFVVGSALNLTAKFALGTTKLALRVLGVGAGHSLGAAKGGLEAGTAYTARGLWAATGGLVWGAVGKLDAALARVFLPGKK